MQATSKDIYDVEEFTDMGNVQKFRVRNSLGSVVAILGEADFNTLYQVIPTQQ